MFSDFDVSRLAAWLADEVDRSVASVEVTRLAGGYSSGAWRLDVNCGAGTVAMVLKAPELPSVVGTDVQALVDFEVAYTGNPAADVGYGLFIDAQQRRTVEHPLPGLPSPEETWTRWARATGRDIRHRDYWTAFGAMILVVTATRAMIQWGRGGPSVESDLPLVAAWEAAVERVVRR